MAAVADSCPNVCSGHGQCLSMTAIAALPNAFPLSAATTYAGAEVSLHMRKRALSCIFCTILMNHMAVLILTR